MVANGFCPTSTALSHSHRQINGWARLYRKRNGCVSGHGRGGMPSGKPKEDGVSQSEPVIGR